MSYDLYFYQRVGQKFEQERVRTYFLNQSGFTINGSLPGSWQAWYENDVTGVYCSFDYDELIEEDSAPPSAPEFSFTGLCFNINYHRPTFFALESMPLVCHVAETFRFLVGDPQEDTGDLIVPIQPAIEALVGSWERHNAGAVPAVHQDPDDEPPYLYYPREKAIYWWGYTRAKDTFQDQIEDDVFVPSICLFRRGDEKVVRSFILWSDALPQVFPKADYVLYNVMAQDKKGTAYSKRRELLPWRGVMEELQPLLDPCDGPVADLVVTPSHRTQELRKIFSRIEGPTFRDFQFVGPDGFVDVYLPEKFSQRPQ
jgi:hypothetical protein